MLFSEYILSNLKCLYHIVFQIGFGSYYAIENDTKLINMSGRVRKGIRGQGVFQKASEYGDSFVRKKYPKLKSTVVVKVSNIAPRDDDDHIIKEVRKFFVEVLDIEE